MPGLRPGVLLRGVVIRGSAGRASERGEMRGALPLLEAPRGAIRGAAPVSDEPRGAMRGALPRSVELRGASRGTLPLLEEPRGAIRGDDFTSLFGVLRGAIRGAPATLSRFGRAESPSERRFSASRRALLPLLERGVR